MGKTIRQIAATRNHNIVAIFDQDIPFTAERLKQHQVDVAIEFTQPDAVVGNIKTCFEANIPVVVGTTGWYQAFEEIKTLCLDGNNTLFTATNFSIGVNLFWEVNNYLAQLMNQHTNYEVSINEIHHKGKLDAPSGTAINTAERIVEHIDRKTTWTTNELTYTKDQIAIASQRLGNEPGTHTVRYQSNDDKIELTHTAYNRVGFATGALVAAEFLLNKKGLFTMSDLFKP